MEFYNRGGLANRQLSPELVPLRLTPGEQDDIVAFLEALTGEIALEVATFPSLPE